MFISSTIISAERLTRNIARISKNVQEHCSESVYRLRCTKNRLPSSDRAECSIDGFKNRHVFQSQSFWALPTCSAEKKQKSRDVFNSIQIVFIWLIFVLLILYCNIICLDGFFHRSAVFLLASTIISSNSYRADIFNCEATVFWRRHGAHTPRLHEQNRSGSRRMSKNTHTRTH